MEWNDGSGELYDLVADPWEVDSQHANPELNGGQDAAGHPPRRALGGGTPDTAIGWFAVRAPIALAP